MRGTIHLRDWEKGYWIPKIQQDIARLSILPLYEDSSVKWYTDADICPVQLYWVLNELGWTEFDSTGTTADGDLWKYFEHLKFSNRYLCVYSSGSTFALKIYFID